MGVDPYLVIMWTSHRLIWDPGATFVSLTRAVGDFATSGWEESSQTSGSPVIGTVWSSALWVLGGH